MTNKVLARNNRYTMSGCRDVANEVRSARAGAERAHASAVDGAPKPKRAAAAASPWSRAASRSSDPRIGWSQAVRGADGGGRKRAVDTDPTLVSDLNALLEPITAGEPDGPTASTT